MKLRSVSIIFNTSNAYLLNFYIRNLQGLIVRLKIPASISGPFFFKTKIRKFVMLKSIHIYKKAGISFAIKSYKFGLFFNEVLDYKQVLYFIYFLSVCSPLGINFKINYCMNNCINKKQVSFLQNNRKRVVKRIKRGV